MSELLGLKTKLEPKTEFSILFSGQLAAFEIPASTVLDAWKRLKFMLGSEQLDPQSIHQRFSRQCKEAANRHFADLVPPRMGEDDLYMHLFRAVYATLAVHYYRIRTYEICRGRGVAAAADSFAIVVKRQCARQ